MLLDAVDHVQLAIPPGGEALGRWFYGEVLGVPEVPKPPHLAIRGGCWFEAGQVRIHLGVQEDHVPATKAHPAFAVADLDRLERQLDAAGVPTRREPDPLGPDALYADDPFGNRLEFRPGRGVQPAASRSHEVVDIARQHGGDDLADRMRFVQQLDRLKTVERQSFILDELRRENTAEHSWHVAVMAMVFADLAPDDVDVARVVELLLLHDVVEIEAGDTGIYDDVHAESKADREAAAADSLFGLLPDAVADRLRALWVEYESGATPEAGFARVFDRLAPLLLNLGGTGQTWRRWGVAATQVRAVMAPVAEGPEPLASYVAGLLDHAVEIGLLASGTSGLILDTSEFPGPD